MGRSIQSFQHWIPSVLHQQQVAARGLVTMKKHEFMPDSELMYRSQLNFGLEIVKADFERKLEDHSKRLFGSASTARKLGEGNPWVIRRLFEDFDPDESNSIDIKEFTKLVRERFALKFSDDDIQALFNHYDIDGGGQLEVPEFIQIFSKMNLQSFKKEKGIIDVPSTNLYACNKFKTGKELQYDLHNEIHTKLWKSGIGLKSVLGRACIHARDARDRETMATIEGNDVTKYKIRRSDLKSFLRDRFAIGIGNEATLDKMLLKLQEPVYNAFGEVDDRKDGLIRAGTFLKLASVAPDHSTRHYGAQLRAVNQNLHVGLRRVRTEFESKLAEYAKRCFGNGSTTRRLKNGHIWVMKRMFSIFDTNKNGELDFEEFTKLMRTEMSLLYSDKDTRQLFEYYDVHKYGVLKIDELVEQFDKRGLLDDWKSTAKEKGSIIDMPSTDVNFHFQFLSEPELLGELKWEIYQKFIKNPQAFEGVMRTLMKSYFLRGSAAQGTPVTRLSGNLDAAGVPVEFAATRDRSAIRGKMSTLVEREAFKMFLRDQNGIGIGNAKALEIFLDSMEQNGKIDFLHVLMECGWKPRQMQKKLAADRERRKRDALKNGNSNLDKFIPRKHRGYGASLEGDLGAPQKQRPQTATSSTPRPKQWSQTATETGRVSSSVCGHISDYHGSVAIGSASARGSVAGIAPAKQRPLTAGAARTAGLQQARAQVEAKHASEGAFYVGAPAASRVPKRPSKSAGTTRSPATSSSAKVRRHVIKPPACAFKSHGHVKRRTQSTAKSREERAQCFAVQVEGRHRQRKVSKTSMHIAQHRLRQQEIKEQKKAKLRAWQYQDFQDSQTLLTFGGGPTSTGSRRWC